MSTLLRTLATACIAGGRQLIVVASRRKSPMWPGGAQQSHILVYGLR